MTDENRLGLPTTNRGYNMKIRNKILIAFGGVALLSGIGDILALIINSGIKYDLSQITEDTLKQPAAAGAMAKALLVITNYIAEPSSLSDASAVESRKELRLALQTFQDNLGLCRRATERGIELAIREGHAKEIESARSDLPCLDSLESKFAQFRQGLTNGSASVFADYLEMETLVHKLKEDRDRELSAKVLDIESSIARANSNVLWSTMVVFVVGLSLTWRLAHKLSHPIVLLTDAARKIGEGRLNTVIDFESGDECGLLAKTFNRMATDLQATTVSREYVDSIVKSMSNSLIVLRPDRTIKSVNQAAILLLGYAERELIGQPMERILEFPNGRAISIFDEIGQLNFFNDAEAVFVANGGKRIPITLAASILCEGKGAKSGVVLVALDISDRKRNEAELARMHEELLGSARKAGMAEVASSVLHNVGNVLNSVTTSSAMIAEMVRNSKSPDLARAVALVQTHKDDLPGFFGLNPKGRQLLPYLLQLAEHLGREQAQIVEETRALVRSVDHIKEIVAAQQSYARVSGAQEMVSLPDLLDDAVRINALGAHQIEVVREYAEMPLIATDKHKVLQILVNLIRNARYALDEGQKPRKCLVLSCGPNGGHMAKMIVTDNGVGIPAANLAHIFDHGFTTRKTGHGFGLHSSIAAAKALGGSLSACSEGAGSGAAFTLELPR